MQRELLQSCPSRQVAATDYQATSGTCVREAGTCLGTDWPIGSLTRLCVDSDGCRTGYKWNAALSKCVDLNECSDAARCTWPAQCENRGGSFHCCCPEGYEYHFKDRKCYGTNKCEYGTVWVTGECIANPCQQQTSPCGANQACELSDDKRSYWCVCAPRTFLDAASGTCLEDYCIKTPCAASETCTPTAGGRTCA